MAWNLNLLNLKSKSKCNYRNKGKIPVCQFKFCSSLDSLLASSFPIVCFFLLSSAFLFPPSNCKKSDGNSPTIVSKTSHHIKAPPVESVKAEEGDEEVIEDLRREEFENWVDSKDYVAVIFYTKSCHKCDEVFEELENIDDDAGRYGIEMIKVNNVDEAREHGVTTFPTLIFWRKEVPILYDGEWDDDAVLKWLLSHKDSVVKELNDENFDKVTQVAQGGVSGDWLILFYEPSSNETAEIMPTWELVASKLNSKMNIGKVDVEVSDELENRFGIRDFPAVIFFRKSKLYPYNDEFTTNKLMSFASRWYKTVRGERVPQKASSLDEIVSKMEYELAQRNFMLSVIGASAALVVASTALIVVFIGISWMRQPSITPPFYKNLKRE